MLRYGNLTNLNINLNNLANNASVESNVINNTQTGNNDFYFQLNYQFSANPANDGYLRIEVLVSLDGTNFQTIDSYFYDLFVLQDTNQHRFYFNFTDLANFGNVPPYFKIKITNKGGQSLASTNNSMSYMGIVYY